MRKVAKFLGWLVAIVIGCVVAIVAAAIFFDASKETQWYVIIGVAVLFGIYQLSTEQERRAAYRDEVLRKITDIHRRLGCDQPPAEW